ncbi:hypothetical protein EA187_13475 [Lujinxingia sediminis]|uniref:PH domain-containing protein n=1 Tax=Lujinxingia sediminis TaxID=2480984 RepID=A0ABY0CRM2_9DELT|nr:hypothetical protein [Lujinxingia sediminis]RVU43214.1 hypothetical protein EA187_13475 [Lujinxingia sediminis]
MSRIRLLSGPAVQQTLNDEPGAKLFRYQLNIPVMGLALGLGLLSLLAAVILYFVASLGGFYTAAFIVLITLGLALCSVVSYGSNYARKHFVATSERCLLVGTNTNAWRVEWPLITRQTLDFEGMTLSPTSARLDLRTAGQHIQIPIFTPFAFLIDLEDLMAELLQHLDAEVEDTDDEDAADEDTPQGIDAPGMEATDDAHPDAETNTSETSTSEASTEAGDDADATSKKT